MYYETVAAYDVSELTKMDTQITHYYSSEFSINKCLAHGVEGIAYLVPGAKLIFFFFFTNIFN